MYSLRGFPGLRFKGSRAVGLLGGFRASRGFESFRRLGASPSAWPHDLLLVHAGAEGRLVENLKGLNGSTAVCGV